MTLPEPFVLALDIGGTLTKMGLVGPEGNIYHVEVMKTEAKEPFEDYTNRLSEALDRLKAVAGDQKPEAIGIGAPNANSRSGEMERPPNFSWEDPIPLVEAIRSLWDLPVFLTNDANAAALGEWRYGAARGLTDFITLTLGTGLGSGIISGGELLEGSHGMAGEIGHINVYPEGRQCNCGLTGCLETYASVTGIKRTVLELMATRRETSVLESYSYEELTGLIISRAANEGDALAREAFDMTARILGTKMADTVAHLDPQAFIISGGLSQAGDILLNPLRNYLEAHLFPVYRGRVDIRLSTYSSEQAVLGPAALAWIKLNIF
jgi:glucokinase